LKDVETLEKVRAYVKEAKPRVLELVSQKQGWSVADTDQRVPILLLSQEAGNIVKRLADVGIACAPGSGYFNLDDRSARLRVPSPDKLEAFLERLNIIRDIP
jgi:histidinol-phosphate aminotransferase